MNFLNLENPSSMNTSYETLNRKSQGVSFAEYTNKLMNLIQLATDNRDHPEALLDTLVSFEQWLHFDIPMEIRPVLFQKTNNLLSHMFLTTGEDKNLRQVFLNLITLLKNQIDKQEQTSFEANEQEWDELQRSVFLLGEWDDQF